MWILRVAAISKGECARVCGYGGGCMDKQATTTVVLPRAAVWRRAPERSARPYLLHDQMEESRFSRCMGVGIVGFLLCPSSLFQRDALSPFGLAPAVALAISVFTVKHWKLSSDTIIPREMVNKETRCALSFFLSCFSMPMSRCTNGAAL